MSDEIDKILTKYAIGMTKYAALDKGDGIKIHQESKQAIEAYISKRMLEAQIELWKNFESDFYTHLPPEAKLDFDTLMSSKEAELKKLNLGDK